MEIEHDSTTGRFTLDFASGTAFVAYRPAGDGILEFYSTYVPPAEREKNVGSRLVATALRYARDQGYRVIPTCWYVAGWIDRHPECRDLLAA